MILTIRHRTVYRYARAVRLLPHRMMLTPRGQHDLRLLESALDCSPPGEITWTQDVFGNLIATAAFAAPADTLTIDSRVVVDQSADAWPVFSIAPSAHSYPFDYAPDETVDLGALRVPDHADAEGRLDRWARAFVGGGTNDTLSLLQAINGAILGQVAYRQRDEEGTQAPLETLDLASGSCRDMATLFIEAARRLGFGARAVSGYLFDPGGDGGQHGATHGWAEVYLPCAGWIAFDPANARMGNANLVPVAVARTIGQIMPIAGSYVGAREDFAEMIVEVVVAPAAS